MEQESAIFKGPQTWSGEKVILTAPKNDCQNLWDYLN